MKKVGIVGVGQTHHRSHRPDVNGQELINEAVQRALDDASLTREEIDAVVIGNMDHFEGINYVDTWSIDGSGGFMKPVMKMTTGGTTGSTVAIAGYYHVASGMFDTVLAIGWEKNSESDTTAAIATCANPIVERDFFSGAIGPLATAATSYMALYGATEEDAAIVSAREHNNALDNPYAHVRRKTTVEDVLNSPMLSYPVKLLDICPRSDGACAIIYAEEAKAKKITDRPAWVKCCVTSHDYTHFGDLGIGRTEVITMPTLESASKKAYEVCKIKNPIKDFDLMELYTPSSFAGLMWPESLGICGPGESIKLNKEGIYDRDGDLPINLSGGVICTNPIGATAMIRVAEAALQIMGKAGKRQAPVEVNRTLSTGFGGCSWTDIVILES
ncbi:MAG: thiolase C-terminal domain-containing protein [Candidatus Jordarchaeum sp.]|uniref:thiolase C-terminal domain-containing protein n=1 Tax=Candidatus Jordarchaeum sp. TaxID=2823881 RepID=UPI00404B26FC